MIVNKLEGNLLDYWVARALGYRFWLEQRGSYRLAVVQWPGSEPPYMGSRDWKSRVQHYEEVFTFGDLSCGYFGQGPRRFSTDWEFGGPLIERFDITLIRVNDRFGTDNNGYATGERIPVWAASTGQFGIETSTNHEQHDEMFQVYECEVMYGHTALIAAMRTIVRAKYGSTVTDGEATHKPKEKTNGTP